jgi:outer membrane receptor protein involved in Fe transport
MAVCLIEPLDLRLSAWTGRIEDLIAWQPGPSGKWRPVNNAVVLKQGLEASADLRAGPLSASGRVTLMRCVDDDPASTCHGCELPYRASLAWGGSIRAEEGRVSTELSIRGAGKRFTNAANTQALPPYWIADALIGFRPAFLEGWTVSLGGTNIFDERYEESTGFPGRPGAVLIELSWEGRI